jgi:DNA-binding MarR family transcriptional regulator
MATKGERPKRAAALDRVAARTAPIRDEHRPVDLGCLPTLIGYMIRRAQLAVYQDFAQTYAAVGIRPAQYAALTIIERNPGLKQKDVSEALAIKRANFVAMCDELEQLGLATREPIATDRRAYALHLTRKGKALMKKLHALNEEHETRFAALIGEEGKEKLIQMLAAIVESRRNDDAAGEES